MINTSSVVINRCLKNPILIHESTSQEIPSNLRSLLLTLDEEKLTEADYLVILVYTMMVETGFIPYHKMNEFKGFENSPTYDIKFLTTTESLPTKWKDGSGVYCITFALPALPEQKVHLMAQPGISLLVFTGFGHTSSPCMMGSQV